jgi:4-carboxymuconolactone decarboxylase
MQDEPQYDAAEAGRQIIRELMGNEYLERRDEKRTPFNSVVQEFSDEVCFGRVWARPGIDPKLRSILNVAMLVALNRQGPLRTHVEGALNSGWTVDELQEVLLHTAVYCGLPAAVEAFKLAEDVIKARKPLASE